MNLNNWTIQDIITLDIYAFSISNGIFELTSASTPFVRNPIIQDSANPDTYWTIYSVQDGVVQWNIVSSSGSGDTVYMYDSILSQWFIITITNGIQGEAISSSPLATVTTQPSASGSGVRSKRRRVRKFIVDFDINGHKKFYWIWETIFFAGSKFTPVNFTKKLKAKKIIPAVLYKDIEARKVYQLKFDRNIVSVRKNSLEVLRDMKGIRMAPTSNDYWCFYGTRVIPRNRICQYEISGEKHINLVDDRLMAGTKILTITYNRIVQGKKDITPILIALDLY